MADLAALRLEIGRTRRRLDRQRRLVHDQAAELADLERTFEQFGGAPPDQPELAERLDALRERVPAQRDDLAGAETAHQAARDAYTVAAQQAGPVWTVGDDLPVLLLPVRLEAVYQVTGGATQLLLRVYPDDVHVDAFEEGLTDAELAAGQQYWARLDAADAGPDTEREAWGAVLSRLGPARGAWAVEATTPGQDAAGVVEPARRARVWSRAAQTQLLPDRFVFSAYVQREGEPDGELQLAWRRTGKDVPDTLPVGFPPRDDAERPDGLPWDEDSRWLVDFDRAEDVGMALKVALPRPDERYPLLTAVGVIDSVDAATAADRVQAALRAHLYGPGLGFLPVGTPTNNTPSTRSAWQSRPVPRPPSEVAAQRAAHDPAGPQAAARLARVLGVDGSPVLAAAQHALDESEDGDLRRLHRAFALRYNLSPLLRPYPAPPANPDELVVDDTVPIPDLPELVDHFTDRVRSRGSLPTLRVGRQPYGVLPVTSLDLWQAPTGVPQLLEHLRSLLSTLEERLGRVPVVGQGDDQDAVILDLLTRVPASLRLRQTQTRPVELGASLVRRPPAAIIGTIPERSRAEFFDLPDGQTPPRDLLGPPDEQTARIVAARPLAALLAVARDRIAAFTADPNMDPGPFEGRHDEAWNLVLPLVDTPEPRTFHAIAARTLDVLWLLVRQVEVLTVHPDDFSENDRAFFPDALRRQLEIAEAFVALEDRAIADLPGLDRLMVEVLDTLSHRIDAWVTSFAQARLAQVRAAAPTGLHVGAYGWLFDVHDTGQLPPGDGYVITPSLHHAATAAVLRSGYLAHSDPAAFAVDLQSWRVRAALELIDGVRSGQPLGVLLGYRFERGLHDAAQDVLIEAFRAAFPLPLAVDPAAPPMPAGSRTAIEARNVVDGQRLRRGDVVPGVPDPRSQADPQAQQVVDRLLADLDEVVDAVADLLLAESVHQLVGGNPSRAAVAADAIGRGDALPAEFDVIRTPRSASAITYQLGAVASVGPATGWPVDRPLARLDPGIEAWLAARLGPPSGWQFERDGADPLTLADLPWCAYDVVLGATRPVTDSPLGLALRAAAGERPLGEAGWQRAAELAVFAELLRAVLAAATPLLPGHLDPTVAEPWSGVDLDAFADRLRGWWATVSEARNALQRNLSGPAPDAGAARQVLGELAAAGVRTAVLAPDADEAQVLSVAAAVLASLDGDRLTEPPPVPAAGAASALIEAWVGETTGRIRAVLGDAVVLAPVLTVAVPGPEASPAGASDEEVEDWLRGVVGVRSAAEALSDALAAGVVLAGRDPGAWRVDQQPRRPGAPDRPWVATAPASAGADAGPRFTTVLQLDAEPAERTAAGFVVDSWVEAVPRPGGAHGPTEVAGVAFHHDRPGARAPQALLVAVAPDPGRGWSAEDLHGVVEDTARLARLRGLDLRDLDGRPVEPEGDRLPDLRRLLPIPGPD